MVHRPGLEHTRLTPSNAEELLFDDVLLPKSRSYMHLDTVITMCDRDL